MIITKIDNKTFQSHKINNNELIKLKQAIKNKKVFLYDVDTTHGFMDQQIVKRANGITDGFPVIGANQIIPSLIKIKEKFLGVLPKVETVDAHKFSDPEIKFFKNVSDIHSEKGTHGAEKIEESIFNKPRFTIEVEQEILDVPSVNSIKEVFNNNEVIQVEKNEIDVLKYGDGKTGNVIENLKGIKFFENLRKAGAEIALVYGVAEEYCVKAAVAACKRFGILPIVIEDAVKDAGVQALQDPADNIYNDVATIKTEELMKL
ncbi:hypothetical protein IKB17_01650 [bacterium]|nr:hypothetical protein [bacterium]